MASERLLLASFVAIVYSVTWPLLWWGRGYEDPWLHNSASMMLVGLLAFIFQKIVVHKPTYAWNNTAGRTAVLLAIVVPILALYPALSNMWKLNTWGEVLPALLVLLVLNAFPSLGEELGWRGFLADRLVRRWGFVRGTVVSSLVWGAWHAPVVFAGDLLTTLTGVLLVAVHGFWFVFLYVNGGLLASWLYHLIFISLRDALFSASMLGDVEALLSTVALTCLGLVSLVLGAVLEKRPQR